MSEQELRDIRMAIDRTNEILENLVDVIGEISVNILEKGEHDG